MTVKQRVMFNVLKNRKTNSGLFLTVKQKTQYFKDLEEAFMAGVKCESEENYKTLPHLRRFQ